MPKTALGKLEIQLGMAGEVPILWSLCSSRGDGQQGNTQIGKPQAVAGPAQEINSLVTKKGHVYAENEDWKGRNELVLRLLV